MAHKTNSKEQFMFLFYHFSYSFVRPISKEHVPTSSLQMAHALNLTRQTFPVLETNLLFLKNVQIRYPFRAGKFFSELK